jgi:hypothetical protein
MCFGGVVSSGLNDTSWKLVGLMWLITISSAALVFWLDEIDAWWAMILLVPSFAVLGIAGFTANIAFTFKVGDLLDARCRGEWWENKLDKVKVVLSIIWYILVAQGCVLMSEYFSRDY